MLVLKLANRLSVRRWWPAVSFLQSVGRGSVAMMQAGENFGRFQLRELLGRGGFASVYRAHDPQHDREVALKTLLPHLADDETIRRRFLAEARAITRLEHPNIITVYETGEVDHQPYYTMEFVEGWTLEQVQRGTKSPMSEALALLDPLASALDYLHGEGIIHRDVKPANVMLTHDGRILLMDFGVARIVDDTRYTTTGAILGTPTYMAPEQILGEREVGPAADLYALGIMAYHMLAGRPPFVGTTAQVLHAQAYEPPPPLRDFRSDLVEAVYAIIEAALAKDPDKRPSSTVGFVQQLYDAAPAPGGVVESQSKSEPKSGELEAETNREANAVPPIQGTDTLPDNASTFVDLLPTLVDGSGKSTAPPSAAPESELPTTPTPVHRVILPDTLLIPSLPEASDPPMITLPVPAGTLPATPRSIEAPGTAEPTQKEPAALVVNEALQARRFGTTHRVVFVVGGAITILIVLSATIAFARGGDTRGRPSVVADAAFGASSASPFPAGSIQCQPSGNTLPTVSVSASRYPTFASTPSLRTTALPRQGRPQVTVLAGSGESGCTDGPATEARFNRPASVAVDPVGNVYVADSYNYRIRKITSAGIVSTIAGSGRQGFADGPRSSAQFTFPTGIAVDASGTVWVADWGSERIRRIASDGTVTTFAGSGQRGLLDGQGLSAQFNGPRGIAADRSGNLYVADTDNNSIRKITPSGFVSTIAGSVQSGFADGSAGTSRFNSPTGIAVDSIGNLFVTDTGNRRIRKISPSGFVTTAAISDIPLRFHPDGIAVDAYGNVFVFDSGDMEIYKIATNGIASPIAEADYFPSGIAIDGAENCYFADSDSIRVLKLVGSTAQIDSR